MGNSGSYGQLIRFELQECPNLRRFSELIRADILSTKTGNHAKAWLPTDQEEGWVTYEVTTGMTASNQVTILATKEENIKGAWQTLQLVKVVGRGKVEHVKLCGSEGAKQFGRTTFVRNSNSAVDHKMRSIQEIEAHAREIFECLEYDIWWASCQEFSTAILYFANYNEGSMSTIMQYPMEECPVNGPDSRFAN